MIKGLKLLLLFITLSISTDYFAQNTSCNTATPVSLNQIITVEPITEGNGAANMCLSGATHARWFSFTPVEFVNFEVRSDCASYPFTDIRVSVYTGSCDNLVCIDFSDDGSNIGSEYPTITAIPGNTYYIEWDDFNSSAGFEFIISDSDMVCDCPDCQCYPLLIGQTCDDENPNTINDVFTEGCTCAGTLVDCVELGLNIGDTCTVSDIPESPLGIVNEVCDCIDLSIMGNNTCETATVVGLGTYTDMGPISGGGASDGCLSDATNASWYEYTALTSEEVIISSSIDLDQPDTRLSVYTGSCESLICLDSDDDGGEFLTSELVFLATAGETYYIEWDDRWSSSEFDFMINVLIDECPFPIGEACDDGDPNTINDLITEDCICEGESIFECVVLQLNIGDACSDGNNCSTGIVSMDCTCENIISTCEGAEYDNGESCDDGDPNTVNDIYSCETCSCQGEILDCSELSLNIGDTCQISDIPGAVSGIVNENCECEVYCQALDLYVGDACDDGLAYTELDMVIYDCSCVGTPIEYGLCADALVVSEGIFTGNISGGFGASNTCYSGGSHAIYYRYIPSSSGMIVISSSLDLDLPDTRLSVHTSCDQLDCIASDDNSGDGLTSHLTMMVTEGVEYIIEWDDRWYDGEFDFQINFIENDDDGDGVVNDVDNCPDDINTNQADMDEDGIGDVCDVDIDGDGDLNEDDCDPLSNGVFVGALCDDGNPDTGGDTIQEDCSCEGVVGITDATWSDRVIELYPNPAENTLSLRFFQNGTNDMTITMYNLMDQIVYTTTLFTTHGENHHVMDVSRLGTGLYLLQMSDNYKVKTVPFAISR